MSENAPRPELRRRAQIVLLLAAGVPVAEISRRLRVTRQTVTCWRRRYLAAGLASLNDLPRPGRRRVIRDVDVVMATLDRPHPAGDAWSTRALADALGVSNGTVARIWRRWNQCPARPGTIVPSTAPTLPGPVREVVGIYADPVVRLVAVRVWPPAAAPGGRRAGDPRDQVRCLPAHSAASRLVGLLTALIAAPSVAPAAGEAVTGRRLLAFLEALWARAAAVGWRDVHLICQRRGAVHHGPVGRWFERTGACLHVPASGLIWTDLLEGTLAVLGASSTAPAELVSLERAVGDTLARRLSGVDSAGTDPWAVCWIAGAGDQGAVAAPRGRSPGWQRSVTSVASRTAR